MFQTLLFLSSFFQLSLSRNLLIYLLLLYHSLLLEFHLNGTKPLLIMKSRPGVSRFLASYPKDRKQVLTKNFKLSNTTICSKVVVQIKDRYMSRLTVTHVRVLESRDYCSGLPFMRFRRRSLFPRGHILGGSVFPDRLGHAFIFPVVCIPSHNTMPSHTQT